MIAHWLNNLRLCFKRAHAAILAASYPLSQNYLFPDCVPEKTIIPKGSSSTSEKRSTNHELDAVQKAAVRQILGRSGSPPYIIQGQGCVNYARKTERNRYKLSSTGEVVREAALQIYRSSPDDRILICAPLNSTCDGFMISLKNVIPECDMYRTNAAFREVNEADLLHVCYQLSATE
ncbi:uncharacterized protein LOC126793327 isoform X2 [Argentina anserina]|uniref:uncharacterized protein LOC126793327 isoform X2 n=1 Tax=Argentina anserina TaxID=57926 RepID=UPI0021764461|nr:uncharacterized protein LOC126793327 isoform X2 [Potentilla anserina]